MITVSLAFSTQKWSLYYYHYLLIPRKVRCLQAYKDISLMKACFVDSSICIWIKTHQLFICRFKKLYTQRTCDLWICVCVVWTNLHVAYGPVNSTSLHQGHGASTESSTCHPASEHPVHLHGHWHQLIQLAAAHLVQISAPGMSSYHTHLPHSGSAQLH